MYHGVVITKYSQCLKAFCALNYCNPNNMSQTNYCANCEAWDRPTHYEGEVCRTCSLFTDLHVATHYIRARQPGMLTILDGSGGCQNPCPQDYGPRQPRRHRGRCNQPTPTAGESHAAYRRWKRPHGQLVPSRRVHKSHRGSRCSPALGQR